jgi:hypothetical protein
MKLRTVVIDSTMLALSSRQVRTGGAPFDLLVLEDLN